MVRDAERYKEEDDRQRDRLQAKNALESYAFNMKQTIEDDKLKDKISDDDRKTVLDKCNEVIQWIDGNQVLAFLHCSLTLQFVVVSASFGFYRVSNLSLIHI